MRRVPARSARRIQVRAPAAATLTSRARKPAVDDLVGRADHSPVSSPPTSLDLTGAGGTSRSASAREPPRIYIGEIGLAKASPRSPRRTSRPAPRMTRCPGAKERTGLGRGGPGNAAGRSAGATLPTRAAGGPRARRSRRIPLHDVGEQRAGFSHADAVPATGVVGETDLARARGGRDAGLIDELDPSGTVEAAPGRHVDRRPGDNRRVVLERGRDRRRPDHHVQPALVMNVST